MDLSGEPKCNTCLNLVGIDTAAAKAKMGAHRCVALRHQHHQSAAHDDDGLAAASPSSLLFHHGNSRDVAQGSHSAPPNEQYDALPAPALFVSSPLCSAARQITLDVSSPTSSSSSSSSSSTYSSSSPSSPLAPSPTSSLCPSARTSSCPSPSPIIRPTSSLSSYSSSSSSSPHSPSPGKARQNNSLAYHSPAEPSAVLPSLPPELWTHVMTYLVLSRHLPHAWNTVRLVSRSFRSAVEAAVRASQLPRIRGDLLVLDQAYFDSRGHYHGLVSCPLVFSHFSSPPSWSFSSSASASASADDGGGGNGGGPRGDSGDHHHHQHHQHQRAEELIHLVEPPESAARTRRLVAHEEAIVRASRECRDPVAGGGLFEWAQPLEVVPRRPVVPARQRRGDGGITNPGRMPAPSTTTAATAGGGQQHAAERRRRGGEGRAAREGMTIERPTQNQEESRGDRSTHVGGGTSGRLFSAAAPDKRTKAQLEEEEDPPAGRLYFSIGRDPGVRRSLGDPRVDARHLSLDARRARDVGLRVGRAGGGGGRDEEARRREGDGYGATSNKVYELDEQGQGEEEEEGIDSRPRMVSFEWRKLVSAVLAAPEGRFCTAVAQRGMGADMQMAARRSGCGKWVIPEER